VEDGHAVAFQLFGSHMKWVFPRLDQTPRYAIGDIRELDPAIADRASSERVQSMRRRADGGCHLDAVAGEQAGEAVAVSDDPHLRRDLAVTLDQTANRR